MEEQNSGQHSTLISVDIGQSPSFHDFINKVGVLKTGWAPMRCRID